MGDANDAVNYITSYTTKHEHGHQDNLLKELQGEIINNRDMFNICLDLLKKREIGMMEIVDMLMGHSLRCTDTACVFINTNAENGRQRMLKPKAVLEAARDNDDLTADAFVNNWADQYYPNRPAQLENHSLINVQIYFKKTGATNQGDAEIEEVKF